MADGSVKLARWPLFAGPLLALGALGAVWATARSAERAVMDASDLSLARQSAAYLRVVTPAAPTGPADIPRLLSAVHVLADASFRRGGLQVTLGGSALLPDSVELLPLPDSLGAALEQGRGPVVATHGRVRATVVPLFEPERGTAGGWLAVWDTLGPRRPAAPSIALAALAALGILLAGIAIAGRLPPRWRAVARVGALVGVLALTADLGWDVYLTARTATDLRLLTLRRLVEMAATARGVRQADLPKIGVGAEVTLHAPPIGPLDDVVREERDGRTMAGVWAATPRTGRGLEFRISPLEHDLGAFYLRLGAWVALVPLGLWFSSWAATARRDARRFRETLAAWAFLSPALAHLLVFSFLPAAFTVFLAFHKWDLLGSERPFVGLANFRATFADGRFLHSLGVTALYTLQVPVTVTLALGAAVLLDRSGIRVRLLRTVMFLPFMSSVVAVALVWQWLYQPDAGLLNAALRLVGLPALDWLGDPRIALLSLMVMSVWVQVGYMMVVFLGGLQAIPTSYHDAARVDGAGAWRRFWWITLPLLRPTLLFVLVTGVIHSFQVFTYVAVMTEGGPLHATDVAVFRIYQEAWEFLRFGTASAMSLVLLVLLLALTWLQFRWLGRRVEMV